MRLWCKSLEWDLRGNRLFKPLRKLDIMFPWRSTVFCNDVIRVEVQKSYDTFLVFIILISDLPLFPSLSLSLSLCVCVCGFSTIDNPFYSFISPCFNTLSQPSLIMRGLFFWAWKNSVRFFFTRTICFWPFDWRISPIHFFDNILSD